LLFVVVEERDVHFSRENKHYQTWKTTTRLQNEHLGALLESFDLFNSVDFTMASRSMTESK
jgi:hypothetical protein